MNPEMLGVRLRLARNQARLNQTEAAQALHVSSAALNQYESGKRGIDALTLEALARLYAVPIGYFFTESTPVVDWEEALRLKSEGLSIAGKLGIGRLIERVRALERLFELAGQERPRPPRSPFEVLPDREYAEDEVATLAAQTRRHFDLGVAPLIDIREFLEAVGYRVFTIELGAEPSDVSGLFFTHPTLGPIIGINEDKAYTRRSYTMAHEFTHGLFHHQNYPAILCRATDDNPIERFAEHFAGQFLAPRDAIYRVLSVMNIERITSPEEVVKLARFFGISYAAMKMRLRHEQWLKGNPKGFHDVKPVVLAQQLGLNPSPYEFGERPLPLEDRIPPIALELAHRVIREQRFSVGGTAKLLGISETEMRDRLEISRPEPESDEALYLHA